MNSTPGSLTWSTELNGFLIRGWTTSSRQGYALTLVAVSMLAMFYQWLSIYRSILVAKVKGNMDSDRDDTTINLEAGGKDTLIKTYPKLTRLFLALLFGLNVTVAYLLMYAIMSFNVGVLMAVVFGVTAVYLFFDQ